MSGSIRRRGAHSWELKFELGPRDANGKRRRRFISFKGTKRAAEIELARLITEHAAGDSVDPSKATLAEFAERWDRDWASLNLGATSLQRYRQVLRLQLLPNLGTMPIQKIRAVHLQELYAKLLRQGGQRNAGGPLSAGSVRYVYSVINRILGHAVTWGVISQNAASLVSPPARTADNEEIEILDAKQIGALFRHLETHPLRPIIVFLLGTGARRGEAVGLQWRDIDFGKNVVRIERAVEQTKAGLRIKAPKTKRGRRTITIAPWLIAELHTHRRRQNEQRLALGLGRAPDDSPVFAQYDGSIEVPQRITNGFAKIARALDFGCTLHGLRHTHVSALIAGGVDILTISRRLGHASASITLDVYGHLLSGTDAKAAEVTEAAFARIHGR
jgi:integrase